MKQKNSRVVRRRSLSPVRFVCRIASLWKGCLVRALFLPDGKNRSVSAVFAGKCQRSFLPGMCIVTPKKRYRAGGFILLCLVLLSALLSFPASAKTASPDRTAQDLPAADAAGVLSGQFPETDVSQWLSRLQEAIPEGLAGQIVLQDPGDASALVGVPHFFSLIADSLTAGLSSAFGAFSSFCGLALLGCLVSLVGEGVSSSPLQKGIRILSAMSLSTVVYRLLQASFASASSTLSDLQSFSRAVLPVIVGICTAGGNYSVALTQSTTVGASLSLQAQLTEGLLSPLISACFAFALLSSFCEEGDTDGLASSLRHIYMTILGVMTAVFSASLALQTALSSASDSVAMRCARYAVGQMIPGVGSTVGGALSTVASSLSLVKKTVGVGGIGVILMILVPPMAEIYLRSLALSLASAFCGLLGYDGGKKLFLRFKGICDMLLGTLCLSAVMSVLSLAVFMKCGTALA